MSFLSRFMRSIALTMVLVMLATSLPINLAPINSARAAMVPTDQVVEQSAIAAERVRVMDFMAREEVREQMRVLGIDADEAARRAATMTDAEVRQIAGHLDQLPAGQSALGVVVGALLVILLVLLITDILGVTNVFPFVKPVTNL